MAKDKKSTKSLTDDWIKQVVTGQKHKLAHYADGAYVEKDEPTPIGFAKYLMRGAQMLPQAAPVMPEMRQRLFPAPGTATVATEPAQEPLAASAPVTAPVMAPAITQYATGNFNKTDEALKSAGAYANGGCVKKMVSGGDVDGPGTGTSDSVPAMLSDGEYVLPADTVDAVGKATLDKLKNATHTPTKKSAMKGVVAHLADGDYVTPDDAKAAQSASDRSAIVKSFSLQNPLMAAGMDVLTLPGRGLGGAYNTAARLPNAFGANLPTISDTSPFFGGNSASMTPYYDRLREPDQKPSTAPTSTATTAVDNTPMTQTAPATPAPAAAKPIAAPGMLQRPDLISEAERLVNTPGLGLAGLGLAKRVAGGVGSERSAEISGQYGLQREAMTANERLEQAKLAEHQRQQNLETWTPDKDMYGGVVGYGRTKGGRPEYVTKESLMAKPTLAQFIAKAGPLNPKLDQAGMEAKYKALYPDQ